MSAPTGVAIIPYDENWRTGVIALFRIVNEKLAPRGMEAQFAAYVERSVTEEIGRIARYYSERGGGFWLAVEGDALRGMFGLEAAPNDGPHAMELRRMYVAPDVRRRGLARHMLRRAAAEARAVGAGRMVLSTSELQAAAIALYKTEGFEIVKTVEADAATNKSIGGMRRLYMARDL